MYPRIKQDESKHAVEHVDEIEAMLPIQVQDHLTVAIRLELDLFRERRAQLAVVVDFAIDSEEQLAVVTHERLRARVDADDRQTLVAKHTATCWLLLVAFVDHDASRPIRPTVSDQPRHGQHLGPVCLRIRMMNAAQNSTHAAQEKKASVGEEEWESHPSPTWARDTRTSRRSQLRFFSRCATYVSCTHLRWWSWRRPRRPRSEAACLL